MVSGRANKTPKSTLRQVGLFGALGIQIVISFLVSFWVGQKLDATLDTEPYFLLTGVVVGMMVCGVQIYWLILNEKK